MRFFHQNRFRIACQIVGLVVFIVSFSACDDDKDTGARFEQHRQVIPHSPPEPPTPPRQSIYDNTCFKEIMGLRTYYIEIADGKRSFSGVIYTDRLSGAKVAITLNPFKKCPSLKSDYPDEWEAIQEQLAQQDEKLQEIAEWAGNMQNTHNELISSSAKQYLEAIYK